jgi:hypothetical protein
MPRSECLLRIRNRELLKAADTGNISLRYGREKQEVRKKRSRRGKAKGKQPQNILPISSLKRQKFHNKISARKSCYEQEGNIVPISVICQVERLQINVCSFLIPFEVLIRSQSHASEWLTTVDLVIICKLFNLAFASLTKPCISLSTYNLLVNLFWLNLTPTIYCSFYNDYRSSTSCIWQFS